MRRNTDAVPAIRRKYNEEDNNVGVRSTPKDTVSFKRGRGDVGQRIQIVEHECPDCGHDTMVRHVRVRPELRDKVEYYCLYPNCAHYLGETLSYAFHGQGRATTPTIKEE